MNTLDPTLDIVFKLLFGGPKSQRILIALLTAVLQPKSPITQVTILNPGVSKQNVGDKGIEKLLTNCDHLLVRDERQSEVSGLFFEPAEGSVAVLLVVRILAELLEGLAGRNHLKEDASDFMGGCNDSSAASSSYTHTPVEGAEGGASTASVDSGGAQHLGCSA